MNAADYVEAALDLLGGEDTEFYLTGVLFEGKFKVSVNCCYSDCHWGFYIGQIELWEVITDCRAHWETAHAAKS